MRVDPFGGALVALLLGTYPLIRLTRGEKRAALQRVWIAAANGAAMNILNLDEARLPQSPRAAAEALIAAAVQIGVDQGMSGADLQEFFNANAERGPLSTRSADPDQVIAGAHAVLAVLAATRLTARDPIANEKVSA